MPSVDIHVLAHDAPQHLDACLASLDEKPCHVHVVTGGFEGSIGKARSHAFTLGSAKYVSFVDDDDRLLPGAIEACTEYLDQHPDCVGAYTDYRMTKTDGSVIRESKKPPWDYKRQIMYVDEVFHYHQYRRSLVELYLKELKNWPTYEEYVLSGLLAAHGRFHKIDVMGYEKMHRQGSRGVSLMTPKLRRRAIARMVPGMMRYARLGDKIEDTLKRMGIHQAVKAVEKVTGKDCGCRKRKDWLNRMGR